MMTMPPGRTSVRIFCDRHPFDKITAIKQRIEAERLVPGSAEQATSYVPRSQKVPNAELNVRELGVVHSCNIQCVGAERDSQANVPHATNINSSPVEPGPASNQMLYADTARLKPLVEPILFSSPNGMLIGRLRRRPMFGHYEGQPLLCITARLWPLDECDRRARQRRA